MIKFLTREAFPRFSIPNISSDTGTPFIENTPKQIVALPVVKVKWLCHLYQGIVEKVNGTLKVKLLKVYYYKKEAEEKCRIFRQNGGKYILML